MLYYLDEFHPLDTGANVTQIIRMCSAFSAVGETVQYTYPGSKPPPDRDKVQDFYRLSSEFNIKPVSTIRNPVPAFTQLTTISRTLPFLFWALRKANSLSDTDIIYSRSYYTVLLLLMVRKLYGFDPVIAYECHDTISAHFKSYCFRSLDRFIALSEALRNFHVRNDRIDPDATLVAYHGCHTEPYERIDPGDARERLDLPPDRNLVMYTGYLYPRKGTDTLILAARNIQADVYIVGGPDRLATRQKQRAPDHVTFTGFVEPGEIPFYQRAADLLVAPYTSDDLERNMPVKLFEYMAAGKPIVTTDRPILREVLEPERDGLLVDPEHPEQLSDAVNRILTDHQLSERLSEASRQRAKQFRYKRRAERILSFLG